ILSLGDDGWLKMSDDSVADWNGKGVKINIATSDFSGWAWNGNDNGTGIGWVSFNCADYQTCQGGADDGEICTGSNCADGSCVDTCSISNYKVVGNVNEPLKAINLTAPNWNYKQACSLDARQAFLRWEFRDPSAEQSAYQVIINTVDSLDSPMANSGKVISLNSQHATTTPLAYDAPYYWWVKVWNNYDVESDWIQYDTSINEPEVNVHELTDNEDGNLAKNPDDPNFTFTAYLHEFPDVDFSWFAQNPSKGEEVQFTDSSKVYLSAAPSTPVLCDENKCDWDWTFPADATIIEGTTASSSLIVKFDSAGGQNVTLKVTDNNGYDCAATKQVNINVSLPKWQEVK
ncbi:MAG: PKD domain-containing protein, partial [Patescibacteria group bacterium]|nr:PKD domain-containing protein [Patescibacteria group bacterium]